MSKDREGVLRRPRIIFEDDILDYGWEKAYIIGNIPQCINPDGSSVKKEELHKFFKIFSKQDFISHVQELVNLEILVEEDENG